MTSAHNFSVTCSEPVKRKMMLRRVGVGSSTWEFSYVRSVNVNLKRYWTWKYLMNRFHLAAFVIIICDDKPHLGNSQSQSIITLTRPQLIINSPSLPLQVLQFIKYQSTWTHRLHWRYQNRYRTGVLETESFRLDFLSLCRHVDG